MKEVPELARQVIQRCQLLAQHTEEPGFTTRTFLSEPMREVHSQLRAWMERMGMTVCLDAVGNLRGSYATQRPSARRLIVGSHLDTVPRAGPYDGILGVVMGVALIELLSQRRLKFHIEVIGFSEEEGLRFGVPFIGSRALVGAIDDELMQRRDANGVGVRDAIAGFGLDPFRISEAQAGADVFGYVEFHIEQGPVLESLGYRLGIVEAIVGQTRLELAFTGQANHAGTTPMHLRQDALAGAAEWIAVVERHARQVSGLVATVGRLGVEPGAANVIPGVVRASLDVRHADDRVRGTNVELLVSQAEAIAARRGLQLRWKEALDQPAVAMDSSLTRALEQAVADAGFPAHRMVSGAGHDAMVIAGHIPAAMLFLRSPGGVSHHSSETVLADDVAAALTVGLRFLERIDEMEAPHG